ncbi:unnamed protein product [Euphydryas editha]|uniref:Uncharacterized protein n=1 Tax=Euphydryas editha TaxID=104508 RepID=A0AAU9U884_EUPED|nr:unnamed protein product [Euphydryas editha]
MVSNIVEGRLAALQPLAGPPCRPPLAGDNRPLARATRAAIAEKDRVTAAPSASVVALVDPGSSPHFSKHRSKERGRKGEGGGVERVRSHHLKGSGPSRERGIGEKAQQERFLRKINKKKNLIKKKVCTCGYNPEVGYCF